ncbi:MAG: cobalamin biosynthesis protein [Christensenellales bacterium]
MHTIGVDNVCERAALMRGGKLIVSKTAVDGVTVAVAVAEEAWEVRF